MNEHNTVGESCFGLEVIESRSMGQRSFEWALVDEYVLVGSVWGTTGEWWDLKDQAVLRVGSIAGV